MKANVTIRTLSLILILTMLFSTGLCGCAVVSPQEDTEEEVILEETPEETEEPEQVQEENQIKPGYIPKDVPLYDQRKYTRIPYGPCAVATHGCGITCAAMAISYLTEYEILPDYLGLNYNLTGKSLEQRMLIALDDFNINVVEKYYGVKEWPLVFEALEEGHLVISLQGKGLFTSTAHFILLTGLNEDGTVRVNDPNGFNYKKSGELKEGYKNGFEPKQITNNGGNYYVLEFTGAFITFQIEPNPYHNTIQEIY